nr:dof zinc finger protein DOF5.1-like [Ipomoea batatas]
MVFGSIPAYLDPANWQQVQNYKFVSSVILDCYLNYGFSLILL